MKVDIYAATPNGSLLKYDVKTEKVSTVAKDMPSDPKEGFRRLNKIDPVDKTVVPTNLKNNVPEQ